MIRCSFGIGISDVDQLPPPPPAYTPRVDHERQPMLSNNATPEEHSVTALSAADEVPPDQENVSVDNADPVMPATQFE